MKKKDLNELKSKSIGQLNKITKDLEKEKVTAQLEVKMGKSKDLHLVRKKKKDIARIKTIITAKIITEKGGKNATN